MFGLLFSLMMFGVQGNNVNKNNSMDNNSNIIYLTPDQKTIDNCKAHVTKTSSDKEYRDKNPDISEKEIISAVQAACIAVSSDHISVTDEEYKKYYNLKTLAEKRKYEKELLLRHDIIKE